MPGTNWMIIIKNHFTICSLLFLFFQIPFLAGCETLHMGDGYVVHDDAESMRFAWFWFNNQNYGQAKKMADVALGINSLNLDAYNILGLIELRNNSIEKAIEYLEKAVHAGGDEDVPILHNLGFAYFKAGDYKKSIEIFNTSLRKKSNCLAKLGIAMSLYKLNHVRLN